MSQLLTINEVAKMLNLHEITIRRHIKQGRLKAVKVGRRVRIRREDLEELMKPVHSMSPAFKMEPALEPASEKELDRRKALVERILKRRVGMEPTEITTAELVREGRREREARYVS
jgi:excisionase family DNA binding protein